MSKTLCALTLWLSLAGVVAAADVADLARRVKAVGPEGAGNPDAAAAWRELSRSGPDAIVTILGALDDASPVAANWLRAAIDAIAEREAKAKRPLTAAALEAFLRDTGHAGRPRRLAFELLCQADPSARARLLPTMLTDPGAELRFDAVATELEAIRKLPRDGADGPRRLRALLGAARDNAQVEEIAKELDQRGSPVDRVKHFGFITSWHVVGTFDNTAGKGHHAVYPPERGVDLTAAYRGKGDKPAAWKAFTSVEKTGAVDFNKVFGKEKNAVAYAHVVIESPTARPVEVRAASATALKIWVNGREVLAREAYHQSFDQDSHVAETRLTAGRNTVLIKVCQNDQKDEWAQNWIFQLRITDALGAAVPLTVVDPKPSSAREEK